MQFALVIIGLIMIVSGSRDTYAALGKEVVSEFTGDGNFLYWMVALGGVGMLGYFPQLKNFSRGFMALIFIAMIIRNGGFFDKLNEALALGPTRPGDNAKDVTPGNALLDKLGNFDPSAFSNNDEARQNFSTALNAVKLFL